MAGLTPLEIQHLDQGGRISVGALARALGTGDAAQLRELVRREIAELVEFGGVQVCLLDLNGTDEGNQDYFLNEAHCCMLVLRAEYQHTELFSFFHGVVAAMASPQEPDHDASAPPEWRH